MTSLETSTTAVRPVKVKDLINEPGYEEMLVVPSKVVPTVKPLMLGRKPVLYYAGT